MNSILNPLAYDNHQNHSCDWIFMLTSRKSSYKMHIKSEEKNFLDGTKRTTTSIVDDDAGL